MNAFPYLKPLKCETTLMETKVMAFSGTSGDTVNNNGLSITDLCKPITVSLAATSTLFGVHEVSLILKCYIFLFNIGPKYVFYICYSVLLTMAKEICPVCCCLIVYVRGMGLVGRRGIRVNRSLTAVVFR